MNKNIRHSVIVAALLIGCSWHARGQTDRMDLIQGEKLRIDKIDGKEDGKVEIHDSLKDVYSHLAYFVWPDSIDHYIASSDFKDEDKKIYRDYLFRCMRRVSGSNFKRVMYFTSLFHHLYKEIVGIHDNRLTGVLRQNVKLSVQTCGVYRYQPVAKAFLTYAAKKEPDEILHDLDDYSDQPYAQQVVDAAAAYAPEVAKKYMVFNNPVMDFVKKSNDPAVKTIMEITNVYGKRSNAYVLLDAIVKGKLTLKEADSIGSNPKALFAALNDIRKETAPIGAYSLEKELQIQALKLVRLINDLHNESNDVRFACVDKFTPDQIYTLIVYSQEDIFTSTFNGLFRRLMTRMSGDNGFKLIQMTGSNHFRTFIKQCAAYGKLDEFLRTMTAEQRNILMIKFAANLDKHENDISQAVEVADAYTSIKDPNIQHTLQRTFSLELQRVSQANNKGGKIIYSVLQNLFVNTAMFGKEWYGEVSSTYQMPRIDVLPNEKLFETNHKCVWHIYFYDDIDGDVSFKDFLNTFRDKSWIIEDHPLYVKIMSSGGKIVDIYANKPKDEYEGQAYLENYFDSLGIAPDVLVHRGHSYYASKTIEKTRPETRIFVLGSCGGYHNLSDIIDKSPEVRIISSKQIGIHQINNPILKELADNIASGKDVNWQQMWDRVDRRLKNSGADTYEKWLDYIPPHKNLGAIFIQSYNKLMAE